MMQDFAAQGLGLRWEAPVEAGSDALRRGPRILVRVSPPNPGNVVTASYAAGDGPMRAARGFRLLPATGPEGEETFAIDLPSQPPGTTVAFLPRVSCAGREADPRRAGVPETRFTLPVATAPAPMPVAAPAPAEGRFPYEMEFLARVTAQLDRQPEVVGETPDGLRMIFLLGENGTVRGPRLNGRVQHAGGDWMLIRRDGVGISEIQVLIRTDDGAVVLGEYGGVVDFGPDGYAALGRGAGPAQAAVQLAPRYITSAASLRWLNRLQCVGLGRVTMATGLVEYDLYAMRSRAVGS